MRGTNPFAAARETEPGPFETEILEEGEPEDED
jgi:hypothetical protein